MSDAWHYRIDGEEFGPVRFADLEGLLAIGRLRPDYEIRRDGETHWLTLQAVLDDAARVVSAAVPPQPDERGEFSVGDLEAMLGMEDEVPSTLENAGALDADAADLESMLEQAAPPATSEPDVGALDLDSMLSNEPTSKGPGKQTPRPHRGNRFYYRLLNQELGPIDLEELMELAADGSINPGDEIRNEHSSEWERADAIVVGLFAEPAQTGTAGTVGSVGGDESADWFFQQQGEKRGPVTFEGLMELAASGQLAPTDEIRQGGLGAWLEAASMVGLFSQDQLVAAGLVESPAAPPPAEVAQPAARGTSQSPPPPPPKPGDSRRKTGGKGRGSTKHSAEMEDWAAAVLSEPDPEGDQQRSERSTARASVAAEAGSGATAQATAPVASTPSPSFAPSMASSAPPRPPAFTPPKKKSSSSGGMSLSLPSGLGDALANPMTKKVLGGVVGLAVLAALWMFIAGGMKGKPEFAETQQIWEQIHPLVHPRAEASKWSAVSSLSAQCESLVQRATEAGAGPNEPLLLIVLRLNRDLIPEVLKAQSEVEEAKITAIENYMQQGTAWLRNDRSPFALGSVRP